jgi:hypothetical protein
VRVAATRTVWVAPVKPGADAVMTADPKLIPFTCGGVAGVVAPCGIVTVAGVIVNFVVSLLARVTTTPPTGAAVARLTGKGKDCPGGTVIPGGRIMSPSLPTVTGVPAPV